MSLLNGRSGRFSSLDALRGIAALVVVFCHLMASFQPSDNWRATYHLIDAPFEMGGRFAVMLFFVLSGFVLALPYFGVGESTAPAYPRFLLRRICRLYPPYAFAVLLAAVLCGIIGGRPVPPSLDQLMRLWNLPVTAGLIASHLLMKGVRFDSIALDFPIWSLIIETRISLVFPLLILFVKRTGWFGLLGGLFLAMVCGKILASIQGALGHDAYPLVPETVVGSFVLTVRFAVMFMLGVITAARLDRLKSLMTGISFRLHTAAFLFLDFVWVAIAFSKGLEAHRGYVDIFSGFFTVYLILLCVSFPQFATRLSGEFCQWLGHISFSLYLIHIPVLMATFYVLRDALPFWGIIAASLPLMLIAGHVMHYAVERPSMVLGRKLTGKKNAQNVP